MFALICYNTSTSMDYRSARPNTRLRRKGLRLSNIFTPSKILKVVLLGMLALVVTVPLLFLWYSRDLPQPGKLIASKYTDATRFYDRKGILLYSVYQDENRTYVKLGEISKTLQQATIAIEDKDFYTNKGFSPIGYLRVLKNAAMGKGLAGASTISQQLVKNVLLDNRRTPARKIKELILSIKVKKKYIKDKIIEMYWTNIHYCGSYIVK